MQSIEIVYKAPFAQLKEETLTGERVGYRVENGCISVWANTDEARETLIVPLPSLLFVRQASPASGGILPD